MDAVTRARAALNPPSHSERLLQRLRTEGRVELRTIRIRDRAVRDAAILDLVERGLATVEVIPGPHRPRREVVLS